MADAKSNDNSDAKLRMNNWRTCSGDSLIACKEGMEAVKDEFFKVAKEMFGLEFDDKSFYPSDIGIWLPVPPKIVGGITHYIGKVRLAPPGTIGGYWASIRVAYPHGIAMPAYTLEGFIISIFDRLNFVDNNVYELQGTDIFNNRKDWQPCEGDSLKTCIQGMEAVKDEFYKAAEEKCGYSPPKEYYPTNTGICKLLGPKIQGGANGFIGLVKLSKPGILGGFYASIRVSQSRGILTQNPFTLRGFIISAKPWLQFVPEGVYRFSDAAKKGAQLTALKKKNDNNNNNGGDKKVTTFGDGTMDYLPTGSIQSTMDSFKNEIKEKCGISGDLDTFQVVSATACNFPLTGINFWSYFVKIYIGIDDTTNFTNFIYVKYSVSLYGLGSIYIDSAQVFPF